MRNRLLIASILILSACDSNTKKQDLVEETKQSISERPVVVPDTLNTHGWKEVVMETTAGNVTLALNPATPQHSDNFIKLVNKGYYDGLLFHRVINGFVIQGGDPDSKNAPKGKKLGDGGPNYTIPAEFVDTIYHFKGALAAARESDDVNPEKRSSASQFYIVTGSRFEEKEFKDRLGNKLISQYLADPKNVEVKKRMQAAQAMQSEVAFRRVVEEIKPKVKPMVDSIFRSIPQRVKDIYARWGGTPFLDMNYTVFGKVINGFNVIDSIQKLKTDKNDRPEKDVVIIQAYSKE